MVTYIVQLAAPHGYFIDDDTIITTTVCGTGHVHGSTGDRWCNGLGLPGSMIGWVWEGGTAPGDLRM